MTDWSTPRVAPLSIGRVRSYARPRQRSVLLRLDWGLLLAALALSALGAVLVWSATRSYNLSLGLDPNSFLKKDLLDIGLAFVMGAAVTVYDYRSLRAFAPILYALSCLALLAVLSPLGTTVNGAHSWISLGGGFEIQPSEFAKLALILLVAMLLGERRDRNAAPGLADIVLTLALAAIPMLLILKEPDLGMVLVLIFVVLGMIALSGTHLRWVIALVALGLTGAVGLVHLHLLKPYQVQRLTSFVHPNVGSSTFGYNTAQAKIAVGSGGLFGSGLFHGTQTNGHFVPEQQTDFVFTVAGEELGFIGCSLMILLLAVVLWRTLRIAGEAADGFGMLLAVGIACWFGFQAFENIGMTMGIMPVTGLPLPFVSYGGSSMFASFIAIGLLQNIHLRSRGMRSRD